MNAAPAYIDRVKIKTQKSLHKIDFFTVSRDYTAAAAAVAMINMKMISFLFKIYAAMQK